MNFPDLRDFYDPALTLPVDGVEYRIEAPSIKDGVQLRRVMLDPKVSKKRTDLDYLKIVFGLIGGEHDAKRDVFRGAKDSVFARLESAGAPWPTILRVAETAALNWSFGESHAIGFWARELVGDLTASAVAAAAEGVPETEAAE
ncbi:hypothetical protein [Tsukamurella sp. NPDC003166]|uniref:DUF7426 family protein n=1 Tax=Tsukamurella sp. NPDC003166 TaxID=3154444 RepID=UPI0033A2AA69